MLARIAVALTLGLLAFPAAVTSLGCGTSAQPDDFVGTWTERGEKSRVMRIEGRYDGVFRVTYRRFYPSYGEFEFDDGKLTYAPVTPELTDVITYDADSDTITITSGNGNSATFSRAEP